MAVQIVRKLSRSHSLGRDSRTAHAIATNLLERSGAGLTTGNFTMFAACFHLPQAFETFDGKRLIQTEAQLREIFNGLRDAFTNAGVTEIERHVVEAQFQTEDLILSTHETRLLRGDQLLETPHPVLSELQPVNGTWMVTAASYALPEDALHSRALARTPLFKDRGVKERARPVAFANAANDQRVK